MHATLGQPRRLLYASWDVLLSQRATLSPAARRPPRPSRRRAALGLVLLVGLAVLLRWDREPLAAPAEVRAPAPARAPAADEPPRAPERTPPLDASAPPTLEPDAGGAPAAATGALEPWARAQRLSAYYERHADLAARTVEAYCRLSRAARDTPLFPPASRDRDAAPFLLPLVDWERTQDHPPVFGLLHLPPALEERMQYLGPDAWPEALAADARDYDFTWMRQALQYDHWDLGNDPRFEQQGAFFEGTIPNLMVFSRWAKLRLAHGLATGDVVQAGAEVRHLAQLLASTNLAVFSVFAAGLRNLENKVRALAEQRGVDVSSWPEASEAQRAGYRTAALDGLNFFYPGVSPAVMQRALQCVPSPCTSLTEAIGLHHALAGYDSADALAPLEAMVSSITCSNAALQQARRANPVEPAGVPTDPDRLEQYLDAGSGVSAR